MCTGMRLVCVGGGPAGLVSAIALKRADRSHAITVFERKPCAADEGWGVTVGEDMMTTLRDTAPEIADRIAAIAAPWAGQRLYVRDERAEREGCGYAVGRPHLVRILADYVRTLGVEVHFGELAHPAEVDDLLRNRDSLEAILAGSYWT